MFDLFDLYARFCQQDITKYYIQFRLKIRPALTVAATFLEKQHNISD